MLRLSLTGCLAALALGLFACSGSSSSTTATSTTTGTTSTHGGNTSGNTAGSSTTGSSNGGTTGLSGGSTNAAGSTGTTATNGSNGTAGSNGSTATNGSGSGSGGTTGSLAGVCEFCQQNSDCDTGLCDTNAQVCQITNCAGSSNACITFGGTCASDGSCQCFPPAAICESCFADTDCASGHCDATNGVCTTATCTGADATACTAAGGNCSGSQCTCPTAYLCDNCSTDADCVTGLCNPTSHQCDVVNCFASDGGDSDCTSAGGTCTAGGNCTCPAPVLSGICGGCSRDSDCNAGLFCDTTNFSCNALGCSGSSAACTGAGFTCGGTTNLPDGGSSTDGCNCLAGRICDFCTTNTDCVSGLCDLDGGGRCQTTSCSTDTTCVNLGHVCNATNNSCNCDALPVCDFCQADSDCASGACDTTDNVCQPAAGAGCGTNCTDVGGTCGADGGCICFP
ncbi:MAG: hypothetical protein JST54_09055 [Deltaproteobacteria bacterium]|nr:hypothetical protein [Deltaproteobacteria bacterium]